jgi:predicted nucleic acid-binding protein
MIVVDASVAVKWLLPEEGDLAAQELLTGGEILVSPSLIRVEVAAAVARKVRFDEIEVEDGDSAITLWFQSLSDGVITLMPDEADMRGAPGRLPLL